MLTAIFETGLFCFQLVGICCVLIATKLEEYYPANIKGLVIFYLVLLGALKSH
jgi:hypothetical protein